MMEIKNQTVSLSEPPKKVKKITGTRFAAILGLNPWSSPFEVWCDMTGTYKIPFEDSKYTIAGKVIEPKVIAYLDEKYHYGKQSKRVLKDPDEYFGKTKEQMHFDHFPENKVFGGMWDARTKTIVYELKTTKRVEDWMHGSKLDAPIYYKLQGALYAYLLGLDRFRMVLSVVEEKDYEHPEDFEPTPENTSVIDYRISTEFPQFEQYIETCNEWLENYITTPISPEWTNGRNDTEIVKALTTAHTSPKGDDDSQTNRITVIMDEIEPLQAEIDATAELIADKEKRLKKLKEQLKPELQKQMKDSDKKIVLDGFDYLFELSKIPASGVDTDQLKADGLYDTYKKSGFTLKLTINRRKVS
jgi:predicted phage-related endonuclease